MSASQLVVNYAADPGRCASLVTQLTEEYERYVEVEHAICRSCPAATSGPFVVYSMLEWKAIYGDGRLDHWTVADIRTYLLRHFPRKISADYRLLVATPTCVRDFVYFMSDRGTLAGDDSRALADAADEVFEEFLAANRDRQKWGLGKRMMRGGLRLTDEEDDRRVLLGTCPATEDEPAAPAAIRRPKRSAERSAQKAAKAARKRNRS